MLDLPKLFSTLWTRFGKELLALSATEWIIGAVVVLLAAVALLRWPKRWERARKPVRWTILAAICAVALLWAWSLRWLSDDAFISFRYASNFADGHGLVFNPGQRVEGYTNFLWTALLIPVAALGLSVGIASLVLSILAMAVALLLTARIASIVCPRRSRAVVPIAALLLASSYLFATYGTSGLETMFAAALVVLSVERALVGRMVQAGLAGIMATMAHPDHGLFYVALGVAIVLDHKNRRDVFRDAFHFALPFVAIFLPYFFGRWWYYGSFYPNTYYAKSGGDSYFSQGQVYILVCVMAGGFVFWIPMLLAGLHAQRRRLFGKFLIVAAPVYLLYVMKIGGDFMLGRLLVPLFPLMAVAVEVGVRYFAASRRMVVASIGVVLAALSALPARVIRPGEKFNHVADERSFYLIESLEPLRIKSPSTAFADRLKQTVGTGYDGPLIGTGCVGIVGFETKLPILDAFGLTDPVIARRPIAVRGRPGHEKLASGVEMYEGGALLSDLSVFPSEYDRLTEPLGGIPVRLIAYRDDLVRAVRGQSRESATREPRFSSKFKEPSSDPSRLACDLWFLEAYYFAHQEPLVRTNFLQDYRKKTEISDRAVAFYSEPDRHTPSTWTRVMAIDFSDIRPSEWARTGTAFNPFPAYGAVGRQAAIGGKDGPFVNSFTETAGDGATGALQSPVFRIEGDVITLRIGGGLDASLLRASLIVDGVEVASATGCGSELMSRRIWDVRRHRNKEASVLIVDRHTGGWGHILVDDIEVWRTES